MTEEQEKPRLYSRQERAPVDVVTTEHRFTHSELERWGAWNRERRETGQASSVEGDFAGDGGFRETPQATVLLPPDPKLAAIETVVVSMLIDQTPINWEGRYLYLRKPRSGRGAISEAMVARVEQLGETLREFYCKRWELKSICWAHALEYEDFPRWMFMCREAVRKAIEES